MIFLLPRWDICDRSLEGILTKSFHCNVETHLSNEQSPGWLGYIGDGILPSYIGIIINQYNDAHLHWLMVKRGLEQRARHAEQAPVTVAKCPEIEKNNNNKQALFVEGIYMTRERY